MWIAEFADLFPDRCLSGASDQLTVLTLSQRTYNDMTFWNDDVAHEREDLLHSVSTAFYDMGGFQCNMRKVP